MTLHQLLHKVSFNNVFSDILRYVPEAENKKAAFLSAFETLCSITPAKESDTVIEANEKDYLGEGVHELWINANIGDDSDIWANLLAGRIKISSLFNRPDASRKITDEMIVADLLWQLVAYGFPNESTALSGYILNNRRLQETTLTKRIEEICSYIDLHQVSDISHEDIYRYKDVENIAWIADMTPYSLPSNKASYEMNCVLDDFMWFNNETKTFLIISASEGYEEEVAKIEEFADNMLKNPTIAYGKSMLPGIEIMAVFISCIAE